MKIGHSDRVWQAAWSPSGQTLASCGGDKSIKIWEQTTSGKWECKATLDDAHNRTVRRVAWSPDGIFLAAASFDSTTSIWQRKKGVGNIFSSSKIIF